MESARTGYAATPDVRVMHGDCRELMATLPDGSVDAIVTSPPYWGGLRDYGDPGQVGLEQTPADYVAALLEVFRRARRVLKPDGSLWLNVGDSYAAGGKGGGGSAGSRSCWKSVPGRKGFKTPPPGYKPKDITLTPFLLADALRRDGWYLRAAVIWSKTWSAEPKRADRPSLSHEYVFLLAPAESYAAKDPGEPWWGHSVWEIPPASDKSHPATMPRELARRCVVSSTEPGGLVLDPFAGSGSTLVACVKCGRRAVGMELSARYAALINRRLKDAETPLFEGMPS